MKRCTKGIEGEGERSFHKCVSGMIEVRGSGIIELRGLRGYLGMLGGPLVLTRTMVRVPMEVW
jgi:serine kinase of HPr protein (carbohydrate metabolism regulator)